MKKIFFLTLLFLIILCNLSFATNSSTNTISLVAVGDILLARKGIEILIKKYGEEYPFKKTSDIISSADISIGNLESCISLRGTPYDKEYTFKAHPARVKSLKYAGFDVLNLANNHSVDFGRDAFSDTLDILEKNNFLISGAGKNHKHAMKGCIIEKKGIKVGFLGFSAVLSRPYHATKTLPGAVPTWPDTNITKAIKAMRQNVDILVVSFHWGKELADEPEKYQRELAHLAINTGADLILGHHPHVIQGIEIYKDKPIFYSLGNFVFIPFTEKSKRTILPIIKMNKTQVKKITIHPIYIHYGQPRIQNNETGKQIIEHLITISKKLGTNLIQKDNQILVWTKN